MKQTNYTTPAEFLAIALSEFSVDIGESDGMVHEYLTALNGVVNFGGVGWKHKRWEAWFDCGEDGVTVLYARKLEAQEIVMNELMGQASNDWASSERELKQHYQFLLDACNEDLSYARKDRDHALAAAEWQGPMSEEQAMENKGHHCEWVKACAKVEGVKQRIIDLEDQILLIRIDALTH